MKASPKRSPADIGRRVLAELDAGRAKAKRQAQARARILAAAVMGLAHADLLTGKSARGLAGRIARKLNRSERHVKRILDTLLSMSDSSADNAGESHDVGTIRKDREPCLKIER